MFVPSKQVLKTQLFIAGAPKCGSFSLYDALSEDDRFCVSLVKEPAYFTSDDWYKGESFYAKYFDCTNSSQVRVDCTVEICVSTEYIRRLYEYNPDAKIILLIRDPLKRAESHIVHREKIDSLQNHDESCLGFALEYSLYGKMYERFRTYFRKEQIFVFPVEYFAVLDHEKISMLYEFIGVCYKARDFPRKNVGGRPKSSFLQYIINIVSGSGISGHIPLSMRQVLAKIKHKLIELNTDTKNTVRVPTGLNYSDFSNDIKLLVKSSGVVLPKEYDKYLF